MILWLNTRRWGQAFTLWECLMLALHWARPSPLQGWYELDSVDTSRINAHGIFIIWHDGYPGRVIRISQGDIGRQLQLEQISPRVLAYRVHGTLRVTWAPVPASIRDGVERYLANMFHPQVGESYPLTAPIAASAPW